MEVSTEKTLEGLIKDFENSCYDSEEYNDDNTNNEKGKYIFVTHFNTRSGNTIFLREKNIKNLLTVCGYKTMQRLTKKTTHVIFNALSPYLGGAIRNRNLNFKLVLDKDLISWIKGNFKIPLKTKSMGDLMNILASKIPSVKEKTLNKQEDYTKTKSNYTKENNSDNDNSDDDNSDDDNISKTTKRLLPIDTEISSIELPTKKSKRVKKIDVNVFIVVCVNGKEISRNKIN